MAQKVIMDVDTGSDDAVAMLMAGHDPALELVAVLPVHGNAPLSLTLENTLKVLSAGNMEHVPVYAGASTPLIGPMLAGEGDQIVRMPFPESSITPKEQHAVAFLIDYYMNAENENTIYMPIGPLTNLALALRIAPKIATRIPRIVTMGGAYLEGNTTPSAEFNILADPEAAHIVYSAGIPITMIGLEVTDKAIITKKDIDPIRAIGTAWADAAADVIEIIVNIHMERYGKPGGIVYDACTVAALINPDVVTLQPMHIDVELQGQYTRGRTVADTRGRKDMPVNVDVGVDIDRDKYLDVLYASLR
jgi:inosine-uridine nucleoside N-ribohydrolase